MTSWMAREISETPAAVERLLHDGARAIAEAAAAIRAADPSWVTLVARGTSDHVAVYARYLLASRLGLPISLAAPSLTTIYGADQRWAGGLVVAISQSGRSPDVVEVVETARRGGALTVVLTNEAASPLARAGQVVVPCRAGPERSVAATKSYVTCLGAMAALVARLTSDRALAEGLERLPATLAAVIDRARPWLERGIVESVARSDRALITGRGFDLATALEIAIKLQETAGMFADGYSTADLEHGPVILAGPDIPVVAIRPDGAMGRSVDGALERVRANGARPWIVGGQETPSSLDDLGVERSLRLPLDLPVELAPAAHVIPGQLLAEAVARRRDRDPDRPLGLTKVTLTR